MKIEVYSKDNCGYCTKAKALLKKLNLKFDEYKMGDNITRDEIISKFPNSKTMPIIVIDNVNIGGYDQLVAHFAD